MLLYLIVRAVGYIGRYVVPTNKDTKRLAKRLFCTPRELADELNVTTSLFGKRKRGRRHKIQRQVIKEWVEDDPHASSILLLQHLINLNELYTIECWVKFSCTAAERATIDDYHLDLLSSHTPSMSTLLVTVQAILHATPNASHDAIYQAFNILVDCNRSGRTTDLIRTLRQGVFTDIDLRLRAQGFRTTDHTLRRAAEVLRMQSLTELELCVLPNIADTSVSPRAHEFVVNHLTFSSLTPAQRRNFPHLPRHNTYLDFMRHLSSLNQHYAIAMVLIMTGSLKRRRSIAEKTEQFLRQCVPTIALLRLLNNHLPIDEIQHARKICEIWGGSREGLIHYLHDNFHWDEEISHASVQRLTEACTNGEVLHVSHASVFN